MDWYEKLKEKLNRIVCLGCTLVESFTCECEIINNSRRWSRNKNKLDGSDKMIEPK